MNLSIKGPAYATSPCLERETEYLLSGYDRFVRLHHLSTTQPELMTGGYFKSVLELTSFWRSLGFDLHCVQMTPGELEGSILVERAADLTLVSMKSNQSLLVQGQRNPNYLAFCLKNTSRTDMHRVWGDPIPPNSLHGFCRGLTEAFFQTTPGSHLSIGLIPLERFKSLEKLDASGSFMEAFETSNTAVLPEKEFQRIRALLQIRPLQPEQAPNDLRIDLLEAQLLDSFSDEHGVDLGLAPSPHRHALIRDLIHFAFENSTSALTLNQVCRSIFSSSTTITVSCRDVFGVGPMNLLKWIRLQQVQYVLQSPRRMEDMGCNGIQKVASHYGFRSRNHFASDYRKAFGESPLDTMKSGQMLSSS